MTPIVKVSIYKGMHPEHTLDETNAAADYSTITYYPKAVIRAPTFY